MTDAPPKPLPVSPISLPCPTCKAQPGKDCTTTAGGFAVVHLARINAAARIDAANQRKG